MIDVTTTIATLRSIATVAKEVGKVELYNQVIALQQAVLDPIAERSSLVAENAELAAQVGERNAEIGRLREKLKQQAALQFRDDAYWQCEGEKIVDGPFCPKCLDADGKTIRMTDRRNGFTICVHCRHAIRTPGYLEKSPESSRVARRRNLVHDW